MSAEAVHYNIHDAKTNLSRIIERVERGEEVIIDRAGIPVAKVVPLLRRANRTAVGSLAGQLDLPGDWDSPQTTPTAPPTLAAAREPAVCHPVALWAITGDATLGEEFLDRLRHDPDIFLSPGQLVGDHHQAGGRQPRRASRPRRTGPNARGASDHRRHDACLPRRSIALYDVDVLKV